MFDPWKVSDPFLPMFNEQVTYTHSEATIAGDACVFPIEVVDPFAEQSVENEAKRISVLLKKEGIATAPKVGDTLTREDSTNWSIAEVEDEQTWWKLTCRGGLA